MAFSGLVYELPLVRETTTEPPCDRCVAICCNYFALEIDTPTCRKDFENLRWYLMHEKVHVFIDSDKWYLQIWTPCVHLLPDHRCGVYETRPEICREYGKDTEGAVNCHAVSEKNNEYDVLFTEAAQIEQYYQNWYKKRYGHRKNGKASRKRKG